MLITDQRRKLLRFPNHVADRFALRPDIHLDTRVTEAVYDSRSNRWNVKTDKGDNVAARFCVMATGCLSAPKQIDIPGADTFKGEVFNTSSWPELHPDFSGKRVGIIGTGSSSVQTITEIAPEVGSLQVFQRTPNFRVPAHNGPADPDGFRQCRANR